MKYTKIGVIFVFIVLFSYCVLAENVTSSFSVQESYDWLYAQADSTGSYGSVEKTALAIMALDSVGYDTSLSQDWLDSQLSTNYCYPSSSCNAYDTAFAVLALNEVQDDLNYANIESWYQDYLVSGKFDGEWCLEVVTSSTGDCVVSYELEGTLKEITVPVVAGKFTDCSDSSFLDLDKCLQSGLISANPGLSLDIDCSELGSVVLTELYKSSSNYYLIANENSAMADFVVDNGCYGKSAGAACDSETTMYSSLALNDLSSEISSSVYLKENYDSTNPKYAALMYLITNDDNYLVDLVKLQKSDGSFNRDYYTTGLAAWALKDSTYTTNFANAQAYLNDELGANGDWGGSVTSTAMVLYGAFSDEDITPSVASAGDECEVDDDCDTGYTCKFGSCEYNITTSGPCSNVNDCIKGKTACIDNSCVESGCNYKKNCEPKWNENVYNCPSDCWCGDSICDDIEKSSSSSDKYYCSKDCVGEPTSDEDECTLDSDCDDEEKCSYGNCIADTTKSSSSWIIIVIIILLLIGLGAGGYMVYKKGYLDKLLKKGGGRSTVQQQTPYTPYTSRLPPQQPRRPF